MAARNQSSVTLTPEDLNELDKLILVYLSNERRSSPSLFMRENDIDKSRQWVSSRFVRLSEHGHIRELHNTGVYEFVDDPRSGDVELPDDFHEIGFVEEFKIFDDAEDVKTVRFVGTRGTADIQITDQTMVEFAAIAKEVFTRIHGDMDLLRELLDEYDE